MQIEDKWLSNNYIRVKNPMSFIDGEFQTEYSVEEYDFCFHKKNYQRLKDSLEPFGIILEKVYSGLVGKSFVVSSNSLIVWQKKNIITRASTNHLYVGKSIIKLSDWFKISLEEREQMIIKNTIQ